MAKLRDGRTLGHKPLLGENPSVSHPGIVMEYYMSEKLICIKIITLRF